MTDSAVLHDDGLMAQRIRSGDRVALGEVYDQHASAAMAVALRIVADREQAEDLVHDAFVAIWQKIDRFDPARGSLRSWIMTIVRNLAIDRLRGARPSIEIGEADERSMLRSSPNPTWDGALARLGAAQLRTALDGLPTEQRKAIELAYFGGRTYREIATLTGVPLGTANGRLRLALVRLRQSLGQSDAAPIGVIAGTTDE
ncbi:MAG: sigma-70 family RNA polymerase sigma factor [Chloroflexi bacterium]|nr:sigma-70 family RNA polymerase sigma factor [Chloroflexota bacterium]